MLQTNLVPALDPNPLPAPYWLFKLLLLVTFFLHIVAMNFMFGGAMLALAARWKGKASGSGQRMFFDLAKKLPALLPATITLGIAPLLFVQVIYGQFLYTSSIVMAWPWFLVLVAVAIAYYGFYYVSFRGGEQPGRAATVMLVSTVLIFLVGFMYSNNTTLSLTPSRWAAKYFAHSNGWNLNLTEPTLIPRYLHFVVSAIALGGLLLVFMALANWKRDSEYAHELLNLGGKTFMYATMTQIVVGFAFLFSLPVGLRIMFTGGNPLATALTLAGIGGAVAAIMIMSGALRNGAIHTAAFAVPGITAVVIACMVVMRDILQDSYLKPYFHDGQFAVKTQWEVLPLFLVLFVGGVALWFFMLVKFGLLGGKKAASKS